MLKNTTNVKKFNNVFMLHNLNPLWHEITHLARKQTIPKGYIWNTTRQQSTFSYLESGHVRLQCYTFTSRERILLHIGSGCLFREVGLLYIGQRYNIRQVALDECTVYNFPAHLLQNHDFIKEYPHLIANLVSTISVKFGATLSLLAEALKPTPEIMVSYYLVNFANTPQEERTHQGISQGELALSLGLHRSTVCRVLKELRDAKVIGKVNKNIIEIFNIDYLQTLLSG